MSCFHMIGGYCWKPSCPYYGMNHAGKMKPRVPETWSEDDYWEQTVYIWSLTDDDVITKTSQTVTFPKEDSIQEYMRRQQFKALGSNNFISDPFNGKNPNVNALTLEALKEAFQNQQKN